jgi:hypothetical protein
MRSVDGALRPTKELRRSSSYFWGVTGIASAEDSFLSQTRLNHFFNEDRDFADEECVESLAFVDSNVLLLL